MACGCLRSRKQKRPQVKVPLACKHSQFQVKLAKLSDHYDCKCPAGDDVRKRKVDGDVNPQTGRVRPCAPKLALASLCIRHTISCNARLGCRMSTTDRARCRGRQHSGMGKALARSRSHGSRRKAPFRRAADGIPPTQVGRDRGPSAGPPGKGGARNRQKEKKNMAVTHASQFRRFHSVRPPRKRASLRASLHPVERLRRSR